MIFLNSFSNSLFDLSGANLSDWAVLVMFAMTLLSQIIFKRIDINGKNTIHKSNLEFANNINKNLVEGIKNELTRLTEAVSKINP